MQTVIIVAATLLTAAILVLAYFLIGAIRQLTQSLKQADELMKKAEVTLTRLEPTMDHVDGLVGQLRTQADRVDVVINGVYGVYQGAKHVKDVMGKVGENFVHSAVEPGGGGARIALAALEGLKVYLGFRKAQKENEADARAASAGAAAQATHEPEPQLPRA